MSDRDLILGRIREALTPLKQRSPLPQWDRELTICRAQPDTPDLKAQFAHRLRAVHGTLLENPADLADLLQKENATSGYCDPALRHHFDSPAFEGIAFHDHFDVSDYEQYQFGITRASAAVAESGTIILKDTETASRLAALSPWIHIAVVNERDLIADLPTAIDGLGDDPNVVWATGPSKTADVEGILIEGVHGPGVQAVLFA